MNVYDFDKTIYAGDSTRDFYLHCVKARPSLLLCLPRQCFAFALYALGLIDKTSLKQRFFCFLKRIPDIDSAAALFWRTHRSGIKRWYLERKREDDLIISASPEFLLRPICEELGVAGLIASRVDSRSGIFDGPNCYGAEKVARLKAARGEPTIAAFYSDSLSDQPLADLAESSYIVDGERIVPWRDYRPSPLKRMKARFLSREFVRFLLIGVVNTFNGVLFSYLFSLLFQPNLAFVFGYISSLTVSYLLNSFFTFKAKLSFAKYVKFCVSYVPNFLIQNLSVLLFYNLLDADKVIAYLLAAIVGIPVTFLMLKLFVFVKSKKAGGR